MSIELTPRETDLLQELSVIPPHYESAEEYIRQKNMTAEEITRVGIAYVDLCFFDTDFMGFDAKFTPETIPNLHSTFVCDVLRLLLRYGLDPNAVYGEDNLMHNLMFVSNGYLAADALALLLENGGDPHLVVDDIDLLNDLSFDLFFAAIEQEDRQGYLLRVHCWMVAVGYGGICGGLNIQVFKEYNSSTVFDVAKLKEHQNYFVGITHHDGYIRINIFDKATLWEVVRIDR